MAKLTTTTFLHLFLCISLPLPLALACSTSETSTTTTTEKTYAPIPSSAQGPALNPSGWRVEPFGGGAYMVTDNQYNGLFFVSPDGVIVVDAPPTLGRNLLYAVGNTTTQPITHVVYSHAHADHIGAAYVYGPNVTRIAHILTKEILHATPDANRPPPDITFTEEYALRVGNQSLQLSYQGLNHQPGNIFVWAPAQAVLMLVDVVYPGWAPFAYLGQAEFVPGVIRAHDQALDYPFRYFVGGHLTRAGTRRDVEVAREYILDLKANCKEAITLSTQPPGEGNPISAQGIVNATAAANPGNPWAVFKTYLDDVSAYCADVTNRKWLGRIAAVDVYAFENAYAMVESLRIDFDF